MTEGKVAVVSGATSGIGRAAAIGLGAAGYRVAILGRRETELAETARLAGAAYSGVCDVSDPAAVHRYFTDLKGKLGRVDVVFNNAGRFATQASFGDTDIATWQDMVNVNLNGAFYVAREAFRAMRDQSSAGRPHHQQWLDLGLCAAARCAAYTATKHAITGLTKAISLDGRAYSIALRADRYRQYRDRHDGADDHRIAAGQRHDGARADLRCAPCGRRDSHMAGLPLEANVQFMTVMATNMPYIGRG